MWCLLLKIGSSMLLESSWPPIRPTSRIFCSETSQSPEVTLPGVNAADFQNFLEVLYLEPAIDGIQFL